MVGHSNVLTTVSEFTEEVSLFPVVMYSTLATPQARSCVPANGGIKIYSSASWAQIGRGENSAWDRNYNVLNPCCLFGLNVLRGLLQRNLVDPASSHMLASKIKPCMSKYKLLYGETANGSLKQLLSC